jgi:Zn-dependent protease
MPSHPSWPVPYFLDPRTLALDALISFVLAILFAVLVNAEAQAMVAALLGDRRPGAKDRHHYIAFLHLDVLGTLCFLVGGFGWAKPLDIDATRFPRPFLYSVLARAAGPVANVLLANIAASLVALMRWFGATPLVFEMVVGVNVTMAVYNLLPLPPLAAGELVAFLLPPQASWLLSRLGPFALLGLALLDRLTPGGLVSPYLHPLVHSLYRYILGG